MNPGFSRILSTVVGRIRLLGVLVACGLWWGCSIPVEIRRPLDQQVIEGVVPGMLTSQLINRLGNPVMVGKSHRGEEVWRYVYFKTDLPYKKNQAMTLQHVELVIKADKVVSVAYDAAQ